MSSVMGFELIIIDSFVGATILSRQEAFANCMLWRDRIVAPTIDFPTV
jgi:hypothetical protein